MILTIRSSFCFVTLSIILSTPCAVRANQAPRTSYDTPDLEGIWTNATSTPLQRPDELADIHSLSEEQLASFKERVLEQYGDGGREAWFDLGLKPLTNGQISLIIKPENGTIPWIEDTGEQTSAAKNAGPNAPPISHHDFDTGERCITDGIALYPQHPYNNNFQIFQTRNHIAIAQEMYHEYRIIPLDGRPFLEPPVEQWLGDSRGHWEGDTLVVISQGYADRASWHWAKPWRAASASLRLTETFTRIDMKTIDYTFTIEDPTRFSAPWTARIPLTNDHEERGVTSGDLYEFACHEGNYSISRMLRMSTNP